MSTTRGWGSSLPGLDVARLNLRDVGLTAGLCLIGLGARDRSYTVTISFATYEMSDP
jgi:hypothetical protein